MREIATVLCAMLIVGLFWLDRGTGKSHSVALWIPTAYLLIVGSRNVSIWLGIGPTGNLPSVYEEGSPLDRAIFTFFLAAGLAVLLKRRAMVGALLRRNVPVVLFFSYCALSILWSDYSDVTFKHWIKFGADLTMALIIATDSDPREAIRRVLTTSGFLLMPLSLLFCKYYPSIGQGPTHGDIMYTGVTLGKNQLGMICLIFGLGSLWCYLEACRDRQDEFRTKRMLAQAALLTIVVWLFWMADSMTSLSCFIMAGGIMVLGSRPFFARKAVATQLLVAAAVGISLFSLFSDRNMVTLLGRNPTLTGRTDIWRGVLAVPHNPLLGSGYESFFLPPRLEEFWEMPGCYGLQEAHNGYLELYLNLGWVGVSLFAVVLAAGYRSLVVALRWDPETNILNLVCFVAVVIYNFTEAGFKMQSPTWILFLWVIVASSRFGPRGRPNAPDAEISGETPMYQMWEQPHVSI